MTYLQTEGALLRAEQNILGEAFLIMASSAGAQQQQKVLLWLLEPLRKQWTRPEWQEAYLTDPISLVRLCADTQFMWSIFHTVTFFDKALKRSGFRKGGLSSENSSRTTPAGHPMVSHLLWMIPPLLKLLRSIHSLWSPSVTQSLPGEMRAAMIMSDVEKISLLGEGKHKLAKDSLPSNDGSQFDINKESYSDPSGNDIRNWLKEIRDSGKRILWEVWLEKLLHPLLLHVGQALSSSWSSLLREGKANVPDMLGILSRSDLKVEVMEEKLLRDLTREICSLFSVVTAPGLNASIPSLEQTGQISHTDDFTKRDLNSFASSSMVGFVLHN